MSGRNREGKEARKQILSGLFQEYNIKSVKDIEKELKDLLGEALETMLESEFTKHLGHDKYERSNNDNAHNGRRSNKVVSSYGEIEIAVPQDRESDFNHQVIKKRQKDISGIEQKIISMYAL